MPELITLKPKSELTQGILFHNQMGTALIGDTLNAPPLQVNPNRFTDAADLAFMLIFSGLPGIILDINGSLPASLFSTREMIREYAPCGAYSSYIQRHKGTGPKDHTLTQVPRVLRSFEGPQDIPGLWKGPNYTIKEYARVTTAYAESGMAPGQIFTLRTDGARPNGNILAAHLAKFRLFNEIKAAQQAGTLPKVPIGELIATTSIPRFHLSRLSFFLAAADKVLIDGASEVDRSFFKRLPVGLHSKSEQRLSINNLIVSPLITTAERKTFFLDPRLAKLAEILHSGIDFYRNLVETKAGRSLLLDNFGDTLLMCADDSLRVIAVKHHIASYLAK